MKFVHRSPTGCRWWLLAALLLTGCEDKTEPITDTPPLTNTEIIRIPVVVHVLYATDEFNISDEKIRSQIKVLNEDFRKQNADHTKTPNAFSHLVTDVGIEFELASRDPNGNASTGITRTHTQVDGLSGTTREGVAVEDMPLYFTSKGGHDAWPTDRYLNIWVAEMTNRHGRVALNGYAHFPGSDPRIDGVVIDPRVFGTIAPLVEGTHLGRTATHEIGHWLNLIHIFGATNNGCDATDEVEDTPSAASPYNGKPTHPQISCGHANLFMNFMDLVDDDAMYMFTHGQRKRMRDVFAPGGSREQFYLNQKKAN